MNDKDAAWLAGYIDGDGTISLIAKSKHHFRSPQISASCTDEEILLHIKSLIGGYIRPGPLKKNCRSVLQWHLAGANKVISVLIQIEPFLRCLVKKQRALLILENWSKVTKRNGCYDTKTIWAKHLFEKAFFNIGADRCIRQRIQVIPKIRIVGREVEDASVLTKKI